MTSKGFSFNVNRSTGSVSSMFARLFFLAFVKASNARRCSLRLSSGVFFFFLGSADGEVFFVFITADSELFLAAFAFIAIRDFAEDEVFFFIAGKIEVFFFIAGKMEVFFFIAGKREVFFVFITADSELFLAPAFTFITICGFRDFAENDFFVAFFPITFAFPPPITDFFPPSAGAGFFLTMNFLDFAPITPDFFPPSAGAGFFLTVEISFLDFAGKIRFFIAFFATGFFARTAEEDHEEGMLFEDCWGIIP